jgi:adenylate cyclase
MKRNMTIKRKLMILLIPIVSFILVIIFSQTKVQKSLEMASFDLRLNLSNKNIKGSDKVAILLIDEASLDQMKSQLGRWPWPRDIYAEVIDFLAMSEAKAVLFDIIFPSPQVPRNENGALGDDDSIFVESTLNSEIAYHAFQLLKDKEDEVNKSILNQKLPDDFIKKYSIKDINFKNEVKFKKNNNFYLPIYELYQSAKGVGIVEFQPDPDGVYRRTHLIRKYQDNYFPVLSLSVLRDVLGIRNIEVLDNILSLDGEKIPIQDDGSFLVNMKKEFNPYSIGGVLATINQIKTGEMENLLISPEEFKDKIVLIGGSAVGVEDLKMTSIGKNIPGVYLHASIISNILEKDYINVPFETLTLLLVLALSFIISMSVLGSQNIFLHNAVPIFIILAFITIAYVLFDFYRYWIVLVAPLTQLVLTYVGSFVYLSATEGREKRKTRKMLAQYVSPAVLSEVMDKTKNSLTAEVGNKVELTVLFSDVRSFTSFSENTEAEQVVEMLNYYLDRMVSIVFKYGGTLDKFIGDAVMAFWGAPIKTDDHARKSTLAALEMHEQLREINKDFAEKSYPPFLIGVGLNTGEVILGNIGSEKKLDYTVIGDNVNLASRMEGLTKPYFSEILISESTYKQLGDDIPCRIVDLVKVKGKNRPIAIYSPLAHPESSEDLLRKANELSTLASKAFEAYKNQDWDNAINNYKKIIELQNKDEIAETFIDRCNEYKKSPPPNDWDGAYTMKSK